jgi:chromosome segregation ATPase
MKQLAVSILLLAAWPLRAQQPQDPAAVARANEQRLREGLRNVTQQLRAAQSEKATLEAAAVDRDRRVAELEAALAAATARAAEEKAAADRTIGELRAGAEKDRAEIQRTTQTLVKWKAAHGEAVAALRRTETARAALESANVQLERRVEARERQNLELHRTATEILGRYADFSLGRALAAREPFTGIARARLESQIQDYRDRVDDAKLKPEPAAPATAPQNPRP